MTQKPFAPSPMHTVETLTVAFAACGVQRGQTILMHSSMSKIGGWICGGSEAVILALLAVLGNDGTLMMPTFTTDNSEPSLWQNPPVPPDWWQPIREHTPAYHPRTARTAEMGIIAETFRTWEGVLRSEHPMWSFAAWGKYAHELVSDHRLEYGLGEKSPIGNLYALDGQVFLLGVGHANNTSLHLAEYRADYPGKMLERQGAAMLVEGVRQWVEFDIVAVDADDFEQLGADYETEYPTVIQIGSVGNATTRLFQQRPIVDYATTWLPKNR